LTPGIFPNAIVITTTTNKYFFGSVFGRDAKIKSIREWYTGSSQILQPNPSLSRKSEVIENVSMDVSDFGALILDSKWSLALDPVSTEIDLGKHSIMGKFTNLQESISDMKVKTWNSAIDFESNFERDNCFHSSAYAAISWQDLQDVEVYI
jgi:hypothetical protein